MDAAGGATTDAATWNVREVQDLQGLDGELELPSGLLEKLARFAGKLAGQVGALVEKIERRLS